MSMPDTDQRDGQAAIRDWSAPRVAPGNRIGNRFTKSCEAKPSERFERQQEAGSLQRLQKMLSPTNSGREARKGIRAQRCDAKSAARRAEASRAARPHRHGV